MSMDTSSTSRIGAKLQASSGPRIATDGTNGALFTQLLQNTDTASQQQVQPHGHGGGHGHKPAAGVSSVQETDTAEETANARTAARMPADRKDTQGARQAKDTSDTDQASDAKDAPSDSRSDGQNEQPDDHSDRKNFSQAVNKQTQPAQQAADKNKPTAPKSAGDGTATTADTQAGAIALAAAVVAPATAAQPAKTASATQGQKSQDKKDAAAPDTDIAAAGATATTPDSTAAVIPVTAPPAPLAATAPVPPSSLPAAIPAAGKEGPLLATGTQVPVNEQVADGQALAGIKPGDKIAGKSGNKNFAAPQAAATAATITDTAHEAALTGDTSATGTQSLQTTGKTALPHINLPADAAPDAKTAAMVQDALKTVISQKTPANNTQPAAQPAVQPAAQPAMPDAAQIAATAQLQQTDVTPNIFSLTATVAAQQFAPATQQAAQTAAPQAASGTTAIDAAANTANLAAGIALGREVISYDPASLRANKAPTTATLNNIVQTVSVQLNRAAKNGDKSFNIQLHPAELGRVEVKLDIAADGKAHATITAEHQDALDVLQKDSASLTRALGDAGLQLDSNSLTFNLKQDGNGQNAGQSNLASRQSGAGNTLTTAQNDVDDPGTALAQNISVTVAPGRVDIRA